eukprot:9575204-Alexandrium_andersonii.AAC.1
MSASLVGSEMCIRDSGNPPGEGRTKVQKHAEHCILQFSAAFCAVPLMPVSYTHLTLPTICSV